jgi:hypothetical protein
MNISLPEIIQFQQRCAQETAWSDHYGALYVAAAYCGIELPETKFPHVWQHGCIGPWMNDHVQLVFSTPNPETKKLFVARKEQEKSLLDAGYQGAKAIGLPVVYTPDPELERIPDSLLIMPQHTLIGIQAGTIDERKKYVHSLEPYLSRFSAVVACISPNCLANGFYIDDFREIGVEVIPGAMTSDVNACLRMRCLMEQFEYVTSNSWGSHIAYALYFGMKVSIFGDKFDISIEDLKKDISWSKFSDQEIERYRFEGRVGRGSFLAPWLREPDKGISAPEIGKWLVGDENKVSPAEMKELFEW